MLIERMMPRPDTQTRQERVVAASAAEIWPGARAIRIRTLLRVRVLLWIREAPSRLLGKPLENFPVVAEVEGEEVVMAICGRLWALVGNIADVPVGEVAEYREEGSAKAYWNFYLRELGDGRTLVSTDTRVECYGEGAKWKFAVYWVVMRPFAEWIRVQCLKAIEREVMRRRMER